MFILNFKILPWGVITALPMIILFEIGVGLIPEYMLLSPPYEQVALELKGKLVNEKNAFDIIVVGDCTGWAAIKPLELEKRVSKKTYNLSVNGAQTYLMSYILLHRYLKNCIRKPELVILQLSASALLYIWGMNQEALAYHILPWFKIDTDFIQELPEDLLMVCNKNKLLRMIPSFRNQFFLRKGFWPLRILQSNKADYERYVNYYREQQGFFNEDLDPTKISIEKITDIDENYKKLNLSAYNVKYIQKILHLLKTYSIKVVVCLTPVRSDEMLIWQQYNLREKLNNKIKEIISPYNNVIAFWDLQDVASDPKYFVDWYHVHEEGAIIYSAAIAQHIKQTGLF